MEKSSITQLSSGLQSCIDSRTCEAVGSDVKILPDDADLADTVDTGIHTRGSLMAIPNSQ